MLVALLQTVAAQNDFRSIRTFRCDFADSVGRNLHEGKPPAAVDTYYAVMSRHIARLDRGAVNSQMYGTCKALR